MEPGGEGRLRLRWLAVRVLLAVAVLIGACSPVQGRSCTLLGCSDRVSVSVGGEFIESLRSNPEEVLIATTCLEPGAHCFAEELAAKKRTPARVWLGVVLDPGTLDLNERHDASIVVTGPDSDVRFEHEVREFRLERFQPNHDCPPICGRAELPAIREPTTTIGPDTAAAAIVLDISIAEAIERQKIERRAGRLNRILERDFAETHGGLWLEDEPTLHVVVAATEFDHAELRPVIDDVKLAGVVTLQEVRVPLTRLDAAARELTEHPGTRPFDLNIDVKRNQIVITTESREALGRWLADAGKTLPRNVSIEIGPISRPA